MPTTRQPAPFACLTTAASLLAAAPTLGPVAAEEPPERPNIVVVTIDDMDRDSLSVYGQAAPGVSPNAERLASSGMTFDRGTVPAAVCQPSRQSFASGQHAHRNGTFGFVPLPPTEAIDTLPEMLGDAGYYTASVGKGRDHGPADTYGYDHFIYWGHHWNREPAYFADQLETIADAAAGSDQPFFAILNTSDSHRPFIGSRQERDLQERMPRFLERWVTEHPLGPDPDPADYAIEFGWTRHYEAADVAVPPYLPDLPATRLETAEYLSSVRRGDRTLGRILDVLDARQLADDTVVIFFSDHGSSLPSSKGDCFPWSNGVPLLIRWPGVTPPGARDGDHFVSTMDLYPTIAEALDLETPDDLDGRSFWPLLSGGAQADRDAVFTAINYFTPGRQVMPMRAVTTADWHYLFQPWAEVLPCRPPTEANQGRSFNAIVAAAADGDAGASAFLDRYLHRVPEALYDLRADPWCRVNLADDATHAEDLAAMRDRMDAFMTGSVDPMRPVFESEATVSDVFDLGNTPEKAQNLLRRVAR